MQFQAPASNTGGGSQLAAMLLQLSASQAAQSAATIDSIGARLLQLSESRKDREFTLQRDETNRDFQREMQSESQNFTVQRDAAAQAWDRSQTEARNAFQLALEAKRNEEGRKDLEYRAQLQAQAEQEKARREQAEKDATNARIAEVSRLVPDLIQTGEEPAYMLLPRFAKVGAGAGAFDRLSAQLQADGHSPAEAADMARSLMRSVKYQWVDYRSMAAAKAALTRAGDPTPEVTLNFLTNGLPRSVFDAQRAAESHLGEIAGGRIGTVDRQLTGAMPIPGAQPGRFTPQPVSVILGAMNATPETMGEDLANSWRQNVGAGWGAATLRPEFSPLNWVTQPDGSVRPREGLDDSTLQLMREGTPAHSFWSTAVKRIPRDAFTTQGSTSVSLSATQATRGASGEGGPGARGAAAPTAGTAPAPSSMNQTEAFRSAASQSLLDIAPFRSQYGDVKLPPNF